MECLQHALTDCSNSSAFIEQIERNKKGNFRDKDFLQRRIKLLETEIKKQSEFTENLTYEFNKQGKFFFIIFICAKIKGFFFIIFFNLFKIHIIDFKMV